MNEIPQTGVQDALAERTSISKVPTINQPCACENA